MRVQVSQVVGCLLVDSKALKAGLAPVVAASQADVRGVLAGLARTACRAALDRLAARNAALTVRPNDLDGFMAFQATLAEQAAGKAAALAQVDQARPCIHVACCFSLAASQSL